MEKKTGRQIIFEKEQKNKKQKKKKNKERKIRQLFVLLI